MEQSLFDAQSVQKLEQEFQDLTLSLNNKTLSTHSDFASPLKNFSSSHNIKSLGVVMDGNRRWAKLNDLPQYEGYKAGLKKFIELVSWCLQARIPHLTVYAFSNENWERKEAEYLQKKHVESTVQLFTNLFNMVKSFFIKNKVQIKIIGEIQRFEPLLQALITQIQNITNIDDSSQTSKITVWICASYGGKQEIVDGVNKMMRHYNSLPYFDKVKLETFEQCLWSADCPDLDLIIRTSGEKRLSGFMTWKSTYAELFFVDELWPDFTQEKFTDILSDYSKRDRRMGK